MEIENGLYKDDITEHYMMRCVDRIREFIEFKKAWSESIEKYFLLGAKPKYRNSISKTGGIKKAFTNGIRLGSVFELMDSLGSNKKKSADSRKWIKNTIKEQAPALQVLSLLYKYFNDLDREKFDDKVLRNDIMELQILKNQVRTEGVMNSGNKEIVSIVDKVYDYICKKTEDVIEISIDDIEKNIPDFKVKSSNGFYDVYLSDIARCSSGIKLYDSICKEIERIASDRNSGEYSSLLVGGDGKMFR